jgi:protein gp37
MGQNSPIEWTDDTLNPWEGCNEISPGCDHCYAAHRDARFHSGSHWGKDAPRLRHRDAYWRKPHQWNREAARTGRRRRVFCGSLCDVMEDRRDLDPDRERLYRPIEETEWLDWQLLTKRPQNFRRLLPSRWLEEPRKNVWLLTTVERQDYLWRIERLVEIPAVVHGVSFEPLLGPISLGVWARGIDWAIIGGESEAKARPFQLDWARSLIEQSKAAGIAVFVKQMGTHPQDGLVQLPVRDLKGGNPDEWPADLRIREFPSRPQ